MDDQTWTHYGVALAPSLDEVLASAQESFQAGRLEEAVAHCRDVVALDVTNVEALHLLGLALLKLGRVEEALPGLELAVSLRPDLALLHVNLGAVLRLLGRLPEAQAASAEAIRLDPSMAEAYGNLGLISLQEGRVEEARRLLTKALALDPSRAVFWECLAECEEKVGECKAAIRSHQRGLELTARPSARQHTGLARALHQMNRLDEAEIHYRAAIAIEPETASAQSWINLGTFLKERGEFPSAEESFRKAIRTQPSYGSAHAALATLLGGKLSDADLQRAQDRLDDPSTTRQHRIELLFALGKYHDDRAEYPRRMLLSRSERPGSGGHGRGEPVPAGTARGPHRRADPAREHRVFRSLAGAGLDTRRPVFIIGLPRSGTTLLEQILASHSQVHGAGELLLGRYLFESLPSLLNPSLTPTVCMPLLTPKAIRRLAHVYLLRLQTLAGRDADRIIDKLPDNYLYLGLLVSLFPNATIIHARRDLRDVALSCWATNFSDIFWSNTASDIAVKFRTYRRLMDHWRSSLPATILEVDYEETVTDLEGVARRLIAALGLVWQPACLDFHRAPRLVRTGSLVQVRQPLYAHSVGRWKHYEHELADLFAALAE